LRAVLLRGVRGWRRSMRQQQTATVDGITRAQSHATKGRPQSRFKAVVKGDRKVEMASADLSGDSPSHKSPASCLRAGVWYYFVNPLDPAEKTITLHRPLTLDLGAVAKGLAIDTAAAELAPFTNFSIDAGGDLYLGGTNERGLPWSVGIRHPRHDAELIASLHASNQAVCTSGDYERPLPSNNPSEHHILDPRTGTSPHTVASATVVAPTAMLADALATAIFVLGPQPGIELLERLGVEGLIVTPELELHQTRGLRHAA